MMKQEAKQLLKSLLQTVAALGLGVLAIYLIWREMTLTTVVLLWVFFITCGGGWIGVAAILEGQKKTNSGAGRNASAVENQPEEDDGDSTSAQSAVKREPSDRLSG